jgi:phosphatidylglycerophosphatase B
MTGEQYKRLVAPLKRHAWAPVALTRINQLLTLAGYVLYPLLLCLCFVDDRALFWRALAVPVVAYIIFSLIRARIDEPRPQDVLDIEPLLERGGHGKSFPSRHVFSFALIATCWCAYMPQVGAVLLVLAAVLGVVRVVGGVHWSRDVIFGYVVGVLAGLIVYLL